MSDEGSDCLGMKNKCRTYVGYDLALRDNSLEDDLGSCGREGAGGDKGRMDCPKRASSLNKLAKYLDISDLGSFELVKEAAK
jgi:hypothetical protein